MKSIHPLLLLLFGLWFCVRWIFIAQSSDAFQSDPDSYRMLAIELGTTGVFGANSQPTAFRPPLYPWVLSFGVDDDQTLSLVFVRTLHSILGALTCLAVFYMTAIAQGVLWNSGLKTTFEKCESTCKRRYLSRFKQIFAPTLASTLVLIDPILVRQTQLIMTETLATFLSAITFWWMMRGMIEPAPAKFLVVGIGIGMSVLCRPTAVVWGGLFIAAFLVGRFVVKSPSKLSRSGMLLCSLSFALGVFAFILPWAARNHSELNRWIFTTTHGGYTLLLANNNSLYDHFEKTPSRNWDDTTFQAEWSSKIAGLHELEQDRLASSIARETIKRRPFLFMKSCLIRLGWLWAPWPNQSSWQVSAVIGVWYTLVYIAAFVGGAMSWRKQRAFLGSPILVPAACLILSLSMVQAVYWSNLRMRSVAMPALYMLASIPVSLKIGSSLKSRDCLV